MLRSSTLFLIVLVPALAATQDRPTAEALAQSLQQRYQRIADFSADFVHVTRGGVLRTQSREQGTVWVKKPGRMRWAYTDPEKKELVSDGQKIYFYVPADRQVFVDDMPAESLSTTPALFLTGRGDLVRDFTAEYVESPVEGTLALRLTPRRAEPEYAYLVVALDPATLQIRALATFDDLGGESTLLFTNLRENRGIPDREFVFRMPRGVDVIEGGR